MTEELNQVEVFFDILLGDQPFSPKIRFSFGENSHLSSGQFKLSEGAADVSLDLPVVPSLKMILFVLDDTSTAGDVSLKVNGGSAVAVSPILCITETNITSLTGSNTNLLVPRVIKWLAVSKYEDSSI